MAAHRDPGPRWTIPVRFGSSENSAVVTVPSLVQQVTTAGVVRRFHGELTGSMRAGKVHVDGYAEGPLAALLAVGGHSATGTIDCMFDVGPLDPL